MLELLNGGSVISLRNFKGEMLSGFSVTNILVKLELSNGGWALSLTNFKLELFRVDFFFKLKMKKMQALNEGLD